MPSTDEVCGAVSTSVGIRAMPKSITFTMPSRVTITLPGLMSRWIMPCACAAASALADLLRDLDRLHGRGPAAGRQEVGEGPPLDELHHDVLRVAVGAGVVDADDVRVVQPRRGLCLAPEPGDEARVARELREQDLDRDGAVRGRGRSRGRPRPSRRRRSAPRPGSGSPSTESLTPIRPASSLENACDDLLGDRRRDVSAGRLVPEVAAVEHDNRHGDPRGVVRARRARTP